MRFNQNQGNDLGAVPLLKRLFQPSFDFVLVAEMVPENVTDF